MEMNLSRSPPLEKLEAGKRVELGGQGLRCVPILFRRKAHPSERSCHVKTQAARDLSRCQHGVAFSLPHLFPTLPPQHRLLHFLGRPSHAIPPATVLANPRIPRNLRVGLATPVDLHDLFGASGAPNLRTPHHERHTPRSPIHHPPPTIPLPRIPHPWWSHRQHPSPRRPWVPPLRRDQPPRSLA